MYIKVFRMFLKADLPMDHSALEEELQEGQGYKNIVANRLRHMGIYMLSDVRLDDINEHKSRC